MCGRYVSATDPQKLAVQFNAEELRISDSRPPEPNYNVAPTNTILVVAEDADHVRHIDTMRWGLVPSWARNPSIGGRMINARAETVGAKNAYRHAFAYRRCIIPADGFYEWKRPESRGRKQPYYIRASDGQPLAFAGLWERWAHENAEDSPLVTTAIITVGANSMLETVHDRMPAILPASTWDSWLDPANRDTEQLRKLLVPANEDVLEMYPVTTDVGSTRSNGHRLIDPIDPHV